MCKVRYWRLLFRDEMPISLWVSRQMVWAVVASRVMGHVLSHVLGDGLEWRLELWVMGNE